MYRTLGHAYHRPTPTQGVSPMSRSLSRGPDRRTRFGRARLLVLSAAVVAVTAACEVSFDFGGGLDTGAIETDISGGIERQTGIAVRSVDCPDDVDVEAGDKFTCTVTAEDGSTAAVDVTQEDDEGNVRWQLRSS